MKDEKMNNGKISNPDRARFHGRVWRTRVDFTEALDAWLGSSPTAAQIEKEAHNLLALAYRLSALAQDVSREG